MRVIYLALGSLLSMMVGSVLSMLVACPGATVSPPEKKTFPVGAGSPKKKAFSDEGAAERLLLLGTTAGRPEIVFQAIASGNIFDPAHLERANAMNAELERGASLRLLAPYFEKQAKYDAAVDQLHKMGNEMEGEPVMLTYKKIIPRIGEVTPDEGWK